MPYAKLAVDLAQNALPAFSFITPNLINDMHNGTLADGDEWLAHNLPTILRSADYTKDTVAIFITWDEGEGGTSDDCATDTADVGCHVAALVVSPSTPAGAGRRILQPLLVARHYRTAARPAQARSTASSGSMASAFNLLRRSTDRVVRVT